MLTRRPLCRLHPQVASSTSRRRKVATPGESKSVGRYWDTALITNVACANGSKRLRTKLLRVRQTPNRALSIKEAQRRERDAQNQKRKVDSARQGKREVRAGFSANGGLAAPVYCLRALIKTAQNSGLQDGRGVTTD